MPCIFRDVRREQQKRKFPQSSTGSKEPRKQLKMLNPYFTPEQTEAVEDAITRHDLDAEGVWQFLRENFGTLEIAEMTPDFLEEAVSDLEDRLEGFHDTPEQFAEYLVNELYDIAGNGLPSWVTNHIDYGAMWEYELRHDFTAIEVGYQFMIVRNY